MEKARSPFCKLFVHQELTILRFAVNLPSPSREIKTTNPFQTLPPLSWIKAYMSWRLEIGTPRLGAKITVNTLLKEFEQLRRALLLARDESMGNKDVQVMKKVS
jgi:hypothetical protein